MKYWVQENFQTNLLSKKANDLVELFGYESGHIFDAKFNADDPSPSPSLCVCVYVFVSRKRPLKGGQRISDVSPLSGISGLQVWSHFSIDQG